MKKCISWFLSVFLLTGFLGCKDQAPEITWIQLKADYIRNGSVSMYSIKNKLGDMLVYYKNHISRETTDCVISQEYVGTDQEFTKRLRLDGSTLNLVSYEIVENNTEADLKKTTLNQIQFVMINGVKKNKTYLISDFQDKKPSYARLFVGDFFVENDFLLTLLAAFPFEEKSIGSYQVVTTITKSTNTSSFSVMNKESMLYKKNWIHCYRVSVNFPTEKANAWFMEEAPHMLIRAEFSDRVIELVDWNGI